MMPRPPRLARFLAAACCLALGSCAALQLATREPPQLYALTPKSSFSDELPTVDARLSVEVPTAAGGLNTPRIALKPTPTTIEYYAGGAWVDVLPVMVETLVTESFDNAGEVDVLGRDLVGIRADYALISHIREFQAEYEGDGPPQVRVRLQVRLIRLPRRTSLSSTSAEAVARAENTSLAAIVRAFDLAFGEVTKRIVEWTVEELATVETAAS